MKLSNDDKAIEYASKAINLDNSKYKVIFNRANAYFRLLYYDLAKADYLRCVEIDKNEPFNQQCLKNIEIC